MLPFLNSCRKASGNDDPIVFKWLLIFLLLCTASGCTYLTPPPIIPDPNAEMLVAALKTVNVDLKQFKCVAKIGMLSPNQPVQAFRGALACQLPDRLRIDLFAPFGGTAASLSSDGDCLYIVLHGPRKYYKRSVGNGSLKRLIKIDFTIEGLLTLLVGRIPIDNGLIAQMATDSPGVRLVDKRGRLRQRIALDTDGHPRNVIWYDSYNRQTLSCEMDGKQAIDGFTLPKKIVLVDASGIEVSVSISRYDVNTLFAPGLFVLPPISS